MVNKCILILVDICLGLRGAYDFQECYRVIKSCEAMPLIPPKRELLLL